MTCNEINLCSGLLLEKFGSTVQTVGTYLMKQFASQPLIHICKELLLPPEDVKAAIYMMLLHNVARVTSTSRGVTEFSISCENILPLMFQSHCLQYVKDRLGDTAELILAEIYLCDTLSMSDVIQKVVKRLNETSGESFSTPKVATIKESFVKLAEKKLIRRCPNVVLMENLKPTISEKELFMVPEIDLYLLEKVVETENDPSEEREAKKSKTEFSDTDIFWQVNMEMFDFHLRNMAIIDAASDIYDKNASDIVQTLIELSDQALNSEKKMWTLTTPPVSYYDISSQVSKAYNIDAKTLDPYLCILSEGEYSFVAKVDDRGGGMYVINTNKIIKKLAEEAAAGVVQEKFGSKYSRIFRLLLRKKYLEQKQLGECSMMSPKDVKLYTYELLEESFITTQEISKTPDYAQNRTMYLFHVNLIEVCHMILQKCYQSIRNCSAFREAYGADQSRLLEKKMRLDVIIAALEQGGTEQEQIDEVTQMITPPEREMLEQVQKSIQKLDLKICQIVNMVIILRSYLLLNQEK